MGHTLDACEKSCPHRDSIQPSPYRVAIVTELSCPPSLVVTNNNCLKNANSEALDYGVVFTFTVTFSFPSSNIHISSNIPKHSVSIFLSFAKRPSVTPRQDTK